MNSDTQRLETFISSLPNFISLSVADRRALVMALELRSFSPGDVLIEQGDKGDGAYFLLSGTLKVELVHKGAIEDLGTLETGALFGVLAMVDGRPRAASCIATTPGEAAFLSRSAFNMLAHGQASIAYPFQRAIGAQIAKNFRSVVRTIRGQLST